MLRNDPIRLRALLRKRRRQARQAGIRLAEDIGTGGLLDAGRPSRVLVVILDGTNSSLAPNWETNAGLAFKLLTDGGARAGLSVFYEPGLQWDRPGDLWRVMLGQGLNRQIARAYGFLAARYREGDRIFLLGYSRGAFAVRSLAGMIDRMGLLRRHHATERMVRQAYRHYRTDPESPAARRFAEVHARPDVSVRMIGVWDTVKALGVRLPILWRLSEPTHAFHNHQLSGIVEHGYHALALEETREANSPEMWECPPGWNGDVEQVWFSGTHADVGGQIMGHVPVRELSNIPFTWMMEKAETSGLPLPHGWRDRFPCDPSAPSLGNWQGWGRFFLLRAAREVGRDRSERVHPSVRKRSAAAPGPQPPAPHLPPG